MLMICDGPLVAFMDGVFLYAAINLLFHALHKVSFSVKVLTGSEQ